MKTLLMIKERIMRFAGKYEDYIIPAMKFLLTFLAISQINSKVGFFTKLASKPLALIIALAGSFLPLNLTIVILGLIVVAHIYKLSLEVAVIVLAIFLILFLIYFRFASKDAAAALLVPVCFRFGIPYVLPVSMGLVGTPSSMVAVACGAIVNELLEYLSANAAKLTDAGNDLSKIGQFKFIVTDILGNRNMIVYAVVFAATVLIVYLIRRLPVDYCWYIAIAAGSIGGFIMMLVVNSALHGTVSLGKAFLGAIISIILNIILQFFCFNLNYNRTEKVQFEDDEYYYYVKAVPKNTVKLPETNKKKNTSPVKKAVSSQRESAVKTSAERPVAQNVTKPVEALRKRPVHRPVTSERAPFGLTGGRPAGQGRRKPATTASPSSTSKVIEHFSEDDIKE